MFEINSREIKEVNGGLEPITAACLVLLVGLAIKQVVNS